MNESKVNGSHGAKDKMPPGPHPPKNPCPTECLRRRPRGLRGPIMMGGEKPKTSGAALKALYCPPMASLLQAFCPATTVFTAVGPKILSDYK